MTKIKRIDVITHEAIADAVFVGSFASSGGGFRAVFTEQNRHPLVHVSPINYKIRNKYHI